MERLDYRELQVLLPHRDAALMINSAMYDPFTPHVLFGYKAIVDDDLFLRGHFPDKPIFPGHCHIECANLVAAVLINVLFGDVQGTPMIVSVDGVRHKAQVKPRDCLTIRVDFLTKKRGMYFFSAVITNQRKEIVTTIDQFIGMAQ